MNIIRELRKYTHLVFLVGLFVCSAVFAAQAQTQSARSLSKSAGRPSATTSAVRSIQLVIEDSLARELEGQIPKDFNVIPKSKLDSAKLMSDVSGGDSLVWIAGGTDIPRDLWVGTFTPSDTALKIQPAEHSPFKFPAMKFRDTRVSSAYILPTKLLPFHNVDEEPRAEFLPLLEAHDRFGRVIGYPAVLMHHYEASTVRHRFSGSECFFFLFDKPAEAIDAEGWRELLSGVAERFRARLQWYSVTTDYSSYRMGERVQVRSVVRNLRSTAVAATIQLSVMGPGEKTFHMVNQARRAPDAMSNAEALIDFIPHGRPGLWTLRVEALEDPVHPEELAVEGNPVFVDRRDIAFVVIDGGLKSPPIIHTDGANIQLDGQDGFWVGTNYYPSNSWWDWTWRDFHPLKAAEDLSAMRRTGYRLVRIWADADLDEHSLRAMDAMVYLAAQRGIVLDVTIFTQWTRTIGYDRPSGEHVSFDFRGMSDFNLYGISLHNIELQKQYVQAMARRWRTAGNVIYDISNETYLKDPDPSEMDPDVLRWKGIPKEHGIMRDSLLFQRWTDEMTSAIREAGGNQLVIPGKMFSPAGGGDGYISQRHGDIESLHDYRTPEGTGIDLAYVDCTCTHRPYILEEFGIYDRWNDEHHFDAVTHYALAAGSAAAMSYEWGISWFERQLSFYPTPLREARDVAKPDPRWMPWKGLLDENVEHFPRTAAGLWSAPSGFNWGSTYHGTPFPASAAIALGRLGMMGEHYPRAVRSEKIYVVVPTAYLGARSGSQEVDDTVKILWAEHIPFGIVQEECLPSVPHSAKILIAPKGITEASQSVVDSLREAGVQTFIGPRANWQEAVKPYVLDVKGAEDANVIARRTEDGTLYSVLAKESAQGPEKPVVLKTEQNTEVTLGFKDYAMAQDTPSGVNFVESTGDVIVNGTKLYTIDSARAIIASDDGQDLLHSKKLTVVVSAPTKIHFAQPVSEMEVFEAGQAKPIATVTPDDPTTIDFDRELSNYILRIHMR